MLSKNNRMNNRVNNRVNKQGNLDVNLKVRQRLQCKLDRAVLNEFGTPFYLSQVDTLKTPLVISSPHSGRHYPKAFQAQSTLSLHQLRQSEDCYIDQLLSPLASSGVPVLSAKFPRIYIDVNRNADEWPTEAMPLSMINQGPAQTMRARRGYGVVPTRIGQHTDIYPHDICANLIRHRLEALYHPYHNALQQLLQTSKNQFGHAVLLDCHSMPGTDPSGEKRADIILGNRYGQACRPETIAFIENIFTAQGYRVALNHPYAGGFITEHYGRPHLNVEAIQIEINKDLYLNPLTLERHHGWDKLSQNMQTAILQISEYFSAPDTIAAQ